MKTRVWGLLQAITIMIFAGCDDIFEYSPNQVFDNSPVNLNEQNLQKLYSRPSDDTITIAFIGDSQRFYDELSKFVDKVNSIPSVDFVLLAGDITDFGLLEEYETVNEFLSDLSTPYIAVIGNHDVLAKGEDTFKRMFGPLDFTFVYDSVKFIVHNTNGREYAPGTIPNLQWLSDQFTDDPSVRAYVPVSHMPPFSADFDKSLEAPYIEIMRKNNALISLHGHIHEFKDGYPYNDGIQYMTSHSFDLRQFVLMKIYDGKVHYTIIKY
jgi:3',5'-cyclic-AMP phosphodiesterase